MKKISFSYQHGFLGIGKMAGLILAALLENKLTRPAQVLVSRRDTKALQKVSRQWGVKTTQDNKHLANSCHFLWLGTKPFQAADILQEIKPQLKPETIVLSMMAGVPLSFFKQILGPRVRCVRLMPNTPARLGLGVTGVYFPKSLKTEEKELILNILKNLGEVATVARESQLDAITGLSGSGPAFVYTVASGLIQGGIDSGLNKKQAKALALKTITGAVAMLDNTQATPQDLIDQVTSKGGTTEAGLKVLKKYKTQQSLKQAVTQATKRSQKISKSF